MLYDLRGGVCFVHIPRTGGVSVTAALAGALEEAAVDTLMLRHVPARRMRVWLGEAWDRMFRFAVMRDPWSIVESDWRLTLGSLGDLARPHIAPQWRARLERARRDGGFARFVREEYLGAYSGVAPGGFWRTWCCGPAGEELGVEPVRFERLAGEWPRLAARIGLPGLELPRLNAAASADPAPWTPRLVGAVADLCVNDICRFGYGPPKT